MSTNETIDPSGQTKIKVEKSKSLSINKIGGEEIFIIGFNETRGKPTQYTNQDDIGEDGLTDYFTIKTEKSYDLDYQKEGVIPINSFFIKEAQAKGIKRVKGWEVINTGGRIGPVKAVKKDNPNTNRAYWTFVDKNDEQL